MASVGEVAYEWTIASDEITWGANVSDVLMTRDRAVISNGRAYAKLIDPDTPNTRFEAVMKSPHRDEGSGVPY
jgi:hypothetical protein